jgi:hypothetical protein
VAYQTVAGEITKELKAAQKKVWQTFPIQVGMFTLLDFVHRGDRSYEEVQNKFQTLPLEPTWWFPHL